jgi:hypothetical protein
MARVITISIPDGEMENWHKFVATAKREAGNVSKVILELAKEYVKKHGEGNPVIPLDKWVSQPELVAFPTIGETPNRAKLMRMPMDMLLELKRNAEAYAIEANTLIHYQREHEQHRYAGIKVNTCPYCRE